jgi:antitoxin ParD1/3/4
MAKSTSIVLGDHSDQFIVDQLLDGRHGSASQVIRESLRLLEARETRLAALQAALIEGEQGEFTEGFDLEALNAELDQEAS